MSAEAVGTSSYAHADLLPGVLGSTVGYASTASEEALHRGVPAPWLTFILSLDGPVVWSEDEADLGTAAERREDVVLGPLHTRAAFVRMPRRQAGIQLTVHPLAARRLLGVRTSELDQGRVSGVDVLGPQVEALRQRLVETPTWPERFVVLEAYVRDRVERAPASASVRPELAEAWRWLRRTGGRERLDGLARHVALSHRHLGTLFSTELGLSPKRVARLVRFDAAMGRLTASVRTGRPVTFAALATEAGYADQSHLDREFRAHLGTSPTGWLAEELRNVQAGGHRNGEA
ncbi:helix-turn-helix domain-containing protein [Microlunatus spumicola]|uniref:Helix-turn-helix domain-containing protein n=1 Tax=Microlunatus spumicola TaxID=81499 RepID=A0ABP6XGA2_9ACTN